MHNQRMVAWTTLHREYSLNPCSRFDRGSEPVHRLGRERNQPAIAEDLGCSMHRFGFEVGEDWCAHGSS